MIHFHFQGHLSLKLVSQLLNFELVPRDSVVLVVYFVQSNLSVSQQDQSNLQLELSTLFIPMKDFDFYCFDGLNF